jgi:hypothetical protein
MISTPGISLPPHWIVGDKIFYNQMAAWKEITESKREFRYYFYEREYDCHDFAKEPKESWDDLVYARCVQLRQKYRNLKLFYSAGRDSHHIIRSFIKYNIPIDELILVHQISNYVRHHEHVQWIEPMAKQYLKHNPKAKISTIILDKEKYERFYSDGFTDQESMTFQCGLFAPTKYDWLALNFDGLNDSSSGFIIGTDKPRLLWNNGNIYTAVLDKNHEINHDTNNILEHFYYAPDLPELHIKQCHQMIRYIEQHYPNADEKFIGSESVKSTFQDSKSDYYDEMCIACGRGPAFDINLRIQNGKNKWSGGHHKSWIELGNMAKEQGWKSINHYEEMMKWWITNVPEAFHFEDPRQGATKGIWGKRYFIKKFTPVSAQKEHQIITTDPGEIQLEIPQFLL